MTNKQADRETCDDQHETTALQIGINLIHGRILPVHRPSVNPIVRREGESLTKQNFSRQDRCLTSLVFGLMDNLFEASKFLCRICHPMKSIALLVSISAALAGLCFAQEPTDNSPERAAIMANDRAYEAAYAKSDVKALADFFPRTPNTLRMTVKRSMDTRLSKEASGLPFRETKGRSCNATSANLEDDDRVCAFLLFRQKHSNQHVP